MANVCEVVCEPCMIVKISCLIGNINLGSIWGNQGYYKMNYADFIHFYCCFLMLLNRYLFLNYFVPTRYVVHNEKALHGSYQYSINVIPFNRKGIRKRIYFIYIDNHRIRPQERSRLTLLRMDTCILYFFINQPGYTIRVQYRYCYRQTRLH